MRDFVNATFGSVELDIISQALEEWRTSIGIDRAAPEYEIAAATVVSSGKATVRFRSFRLQFRRTSGSLGMPWNWRRSRCIPQVRLRRRGA